MGWGAGYMDTLIFLKAIPIHSLPSHCSVYVYWIMTFIHFLMVYFSSHNLHPSRETIWFLWILAVPLGLKVLGTQAEVKKHLGSASMNSHMALRSYSILT